MLNSIGKLSKVFFVVLLSSSTLFSQTEWAVDSDGDWNHAANWNPATVPSLTDVLFGSVISAPRTVTIDGVVQINSIMLDNANAYTLTGGVLSLATASGIQAQTGSHSISSQIELPSGVTTEFQTNASLTLTLSGEISGTGTFEKKGSGTIVLGAPNTYSGGTTVSNGELKGSTSSLQGDIVNSGVVTFKQGSDGTYSGEMSGSGSLTKDGTGTVTLDGTNTYTGGSSLKGGTLSIASDGSLGNGGDLTFDGGTLGTTATISSSRVVNLSGAGTISPDSSTTLTLNGAITGTGSLTKSGGGTLALAGTNTYSGGTTVSSGELKGSTSSLQGDINNSGAVHFDQTVNDSYSGVISGSGSLKKSGNATLVLTGANTYSGGTTVSAGTLTGKTTTIQGDITNDGNVELSQPGDGIYAGVMSGSGVLLKTDTGTIILSGINSYTGGTEVQGGALSIGKDSNLGDVSAPLSLNGGNVISTDTFTSGRTVTITGGGGVSPIAGTTLTLSGTISGAGELTKNGGGTLTLSASNTYGNGVAINGGTLSVSSDHNLGASGGNVSFGGGTLNTTGTFTSSRGIDLFTQGILSPDASTTLTLSGVVSGSGSLIKNGEGTVILNGINTYSGGTVVLNGILEGSTSSLKGDISNSGAVHFDQVSNDTYSGVISGSGSLQKSGVGTLVLSGANSYLGGTTVSAGTLEGTTTSLQGDIVNSGVVTFNQGSSGIYGGSVSGSGSLVKDGSGSVALIGANSYSGGTTIANGTLQGSTVSIQGGIVNNDFLVFDQNFDGTFSGTLSGSGSLLKEGTGTLSVTANSLSFTGPTTINGGTLAINGSLGGSVSVAPGGRLSGGGSVNSLSNSGIVEPGNSIGVIHVGTNYTQAANGTLIIEADNLGNSDLLDVVGSATLGGNLSLSLLPGVYSGEEFYTILTAGGGVSPSFDHFSEIHGVPFTLNYFPTSVQIDLNFQGSILPVPLNELKGNAKAVATYLFCPDFFPSNPDLQQVLNQIVTLPPDQFIQELDQLSPAQFGALPMVNLQNSHLIADTFVSSLEKLYWHTPCSESGGRQTSFWVTPVAQSQVQDPTEELEGFNAKTFGVGVGGSHPLTESLYFAAGGGYTYTNLGWKENGGDGRLNSLYFVPSLAFVKKNWFANALLKGGVNFYDVERKIRFTGLSRTAQSHHHSYDLLTRIDGGYKWSWRDKSQQYSAFLIPLVRLSYLNIVEEGYTESGADSINLRVDRKHSAFLQPEALLKALVEFQVGNHCITPMAEMGWIGNLRLTSPNYTSKLYKQQLCNPNFTVRSFHRHTNQFVLGTGLSITKLDRYSVDLIYEGRFFDGLYINLGKLTCDFQF